MLELNEMNNEMMKAGTLIEALPYIQRFSGKVVVVKYGGSAMLDEELKYNVIKDVALLKLIGMKPIIVHGGGKEISKWVKLSGKEAEFYKGLRITDKETMEIAEMVLNKVNKELVGLMQKMEMNAVGICGKDANMLHVEKRMPDGKDIGYVGNVTSVNTDILYTLMDAGFIPVIAPIGMDENFDSYNINADDAACAVAKAMKAEKLVFLTDIEGVFVDPTNKKTLISEMDVNTAREFIANGVVGGGMLPKLTNCVEAIDQGVSRVHILDGRVAHCLLLEFFTEKGIGTAILKEPLF
ncbi:MAG: acetylglutamate kinase [Clostridiales bacterium]|nr:acetylglutamate kinase [Clostridiales bacterium]